jgi:hypothetical protein
VVSTEYSGQWDTGKKCGLGKLTTYNERGVAIETRTGYWHLGRPGRTHAGKPHGRNVYHDLRTGAWLDYEWNDGGFLDGKNPSVGGSRTARCTRARSSGGKAGSGREPAPCTASTGRYLPTALS